MPKLVYGLLALGGVLVAGVLIAPGFIDWNRFKPEIIAQVSEATGRAVAIDGPIDLAVLPTPTISVGDARLANIESAATPDMISVRSADIRIAFWPLLYGEIKVVSVTLLEPVIELERFEDGRVNWIFGEDADTTPMDQSDDRGGDGGTLPIALDDVEIVGGKLIYRDHAADITETIAGIDARIAAPSLKGPFTGSGQAVFQDVPFEIEARLGETRANGARALRLELTGAGARATFSGSVNPNAGATGPAVTGAVRLSGDHLATLLEAAQAVSESGFVPPVLIGKPFDIGGRVTYAAGLVGIDDLKIEVGDARGKGQLTLGLGRTPRFDIAVSFNRLDLDSLFLVEGLAPAAGPRGGPTTTVSLPARVEPVGTDAEERIFEIPRDLNGTVDIKIDALVYRRQIVRQAILNAGIVGGIFNIQRLSALLPGSSDVTVFGSVSAREGLPHFAGRIEAASDNLRAMLDWMDVGISTVPADRLRSLNLTADIDGDPDRGQVTNIDIALDSSRIIGGVAYVMHDRPAFGINLRLDRLNIDGYLPLPEEDQERDEAAVPPEGVPESLAEDSLATVVALLAPLTTFDADFVVRADQITRRGMPIQEIVIDGLLQGGALTLREARVLGAAGSRLGFVGKLSGLGDHPKIDGHLSFNTEDLRALSRWVPAIETLPRPLTGGLNIEADTKGDLDRLSVDGDLQTLGARVTAKGTISDLLVVPSLDIAVDATHPNLGDLLGAFDMLRGGAASRLAEAPIAVNATLVGGLMGLDIDAVATFLDGETTVKGNIDLFKAERRFDLTGRSSHPNIGALIAAAAGLEVERLPEALTGPATLDVEALGAVEGFDLVGRLETRNTALDVEGRIEQPESGLAYTLDLKFENPSFAALLEDFGQRMETAVAPGPVVIAGRVAGDPAKMTVSKLTVTLGDETADATGDVVFGGARPKVTAKIAGGAMIAEHWLALAAGPLDMVDRATAQEVPDPAATLARDSSPAGKPWSRKPFDLEGLRVLDAVVELTADSIGLGLGAHKLENARIDGTLSNGIITVSRLKGRILGGEIEASGRLDGRNLAVVRLESAIKGADLQESLRAFAGIEQITGRADADIEISSRGRSQYELIASLNGSAVLAGVGGGEIDGIDLRRLSDRLGDLNPEGNFLGTAKDALQGGRTRYESLEGTIEIIDGRLRTNDMRLKADGGVGLLTGQVNLGRWTEDLTVMFDLADHPDAPAVGLNWTGAPDAPVRRLETDDLRRYLAARALGDGADEAVGGATVPAADIFEDLIRGAASSDGSPNMLEELLGGLRPPPSENTGEPTSVGTQDFEAVPEIVTGPETATGPESVTGPETAELEPMDPIIVAPAAVPEPAPMAAPTAVAVPRQEGAPAAEPGAVAPPSAVPAPADAPEPAAAELSPEPVPETPASVTDPFDDILENLLR